MNTDRYGLFKQEREGPVRRSFFNDLEEARQAGQKLADREHHDFFIYCFKLCREVARFEATTKK